MNVYSMQLIEIKFLLMVVDGQRLVNFFDHPIKIKLPKDMVFFSKIINFIYE